VAEQHTSAKRPETSFADTPNHFRGHRKMNWTILRYARCLEHKINVFADQCTGLVAIVAAREKLIVPRMTVANVRGHGDGQRSLFE